MLKAWPQLATVVADAFAFAFHCSMAGESIGEYNPVLTLVGICAGLLILYEGGFFAVWGVVP